MSERTGDVTREPDASRDTAQGGSAPHGATGSQSGPSAAEGGHPPGSAAEAWCPVCQERVALLLNEPILQPSGGILLAFFVFVCPQCTVVLAPAGVVPLGPDPAAVAARAGGLLVPPGGPGPGPGPRAPGGGNGPLAFGGRAEIPANRAWRRRMGQ